MAFAFVWRVYVVGPAGAWEWERRGVWQRQSGALRGRRLATVEEQRVAAIGDRQEKRESSVRRAIGNVMDSTAPKHFPENGTVLGRQISPSRRCPARSLLVSDHSSDVKPT